MATCPSEVDIIEAALSNARSKVTVDAALGDASPLGCVERELLSRNDLSLDSPGMVYTDADATNVSEYGAQLKSWVDLQVDMRLDLVLVRREEEAASEMSAVKEMQSRTFALVESLTEEITRLKANVPLQDSVEVAARSVATEARQVELTEGRLLQDLKDSHRRFCDDIDTRLVDLRGDLTREVQREFDGLAKSIAALSTETTAALGCESDAISKLDKRLWLLDQRLERRFEELADRYEHGVSQPLQRRESSPRYTMLYQQMQELDLEVQRLYKMIQVMPAPSHRSFEQAIMQQPKPQTIRVQAVQQAKKNDYNYGNR